MIDIHAPMELDDGTPVTLISSHHDELHGIFKVGWIGKDPYRDRDSNRNNYESWWFRVEDGSFDGGNKKTFHYVVNSFLPTDTIVEDWS